MISLSPNTQAILLLTAPLIAGGDASSTELLTPGEYKRLARHLRDIQSQPADLIASGATALLDDCGAVIDKDRLQRLLGRGFLLGQVVERWQARAIWVVSRADAGYPRRLKARLRDDAPAVLYGCGDGRLLDAGGLAVVGSRDADDALIHYTMEIGGLAARAGRAIVSGGAKGVDQAAMRAALEAGGLVSGILADSLERTAMNRDHRNKVMDGQLVLISPYDPGAGFNTGHAMQRNKLIYALSDAALVVNADVRKGGTRAGAIEQLGKFRFVPLYVRSTGAPSAGLDALRSEGALPWPNPRDAEELAGVFDVDAAIPEPSLFAGADPAGTVAAPEEAPERPGELEPASAVSGHASDARLEQAAPRSPADTLFATVRSLIRQILSEPKKDSDVSAELGVSPAQAKVWLKRMLDEGEIEKRRHPAGYVAKSADLFELR